MIGGLALVILGSFVHSSGGKHHVIGVEQDLNNWSGMIIVCVDKFLWVSEVPDLTAVILAATDQHRTVRRYIDRVDLLVVSFKGCIVVLIPDIPQFYVGVITATCHSIIIVGKNPKTVH
jgi:hypothetical protein